MSTDVGLLEHISDLAKKQLSNTGLSNEQISSRSYQVAKVVIQLYRIMKLYEREDIERSLIRHIDLQIKICNERNLLFDN